jgi:hypothetical protein
VTILKDMQATAASIVAGLFRKPPPIADVAALADFIDERAAFTVQKCVFEYSRARAGTMSQKLFKEQGFRDAVDASRWLGYPIGLVDVSEAVLSTLRDDGTAVGPDAVTGLIRTAQSITARYPVPEGFESDFWEKARIAVAERLKRASLAPPRLVKDIPKDTAQVFFDNLPIHPELRKNDFELIRNTLCANLCRISDDLSQRLDRPALVAALAAEGAQSA